MAPDVEPEDVQRNGFELFHEQFSIPEAVIETFLDRRFDPDRSFADNARAFWVWLADPAEDVVTECPECGASVEGAEVAAGEIVLHPCGCAISEIDESEVPV